MQRELQYFMSTSTFSIRIYETLSTLAVASRPTLSYIQFHQRRTSYQKLYHVKCAKLWSGISLSLPEPKSISKAAMKATVFQMHIPRYKDQIVSQYLSSVLWVKSELYYLMDRSHFSNSYKGNLKKAIYS